MAKGTEEGRFITKRKVRAAIRAEVDAFYSSSSPSWHPERPVLLESDVSSLIDGVLQRLYPSPSKPHWTAPMKGDING